MNILPTMKDFESHINETFEIQVTTAGSFPIALIKINDHSNEQWEGFSLLFTGPFEQALGQGNHRVKHTVLGEFELFLVPVEYPKKDAMYYQAVFSRFK